MKKRLLQLFLVTVITGTTLSMSGCGNNDVKRLENKIDRISEQLEGESKEIELQNKLDEANSKIQSLEQQLQGNSSTNFIDIKFPEDGNKYKATNKKIRFYTDSSCTQEIQDEVIITSPIVDDEIKAPNGIGVCGVRSNDTVIFSVEYPYLEKIK